MLKASWPMPNAQCQMLYYPNIGCRRYTPLSSCPRPPAVSSALALRTVGHSGLSFSVLWWQKTKSVCCVFVSVCRHSKNSKDNNSSTQVCKSTNTGCHAWLREIPRLFTLVGGICSVPQRSADWLHSWYYHSTQAAALVVCVVSLVQSACAWFFRK